MLIRLVKYFVGVLQGQSAGLEPEMSLFKLFYGSVGVFFPPFFLSFFFPPSCAAEQNDPARSNLPRADPFHLRENVHIESPCCREREGQRGSEINRMIDGERQTRTGRSERQ